MALADLLARLAHAQNVHETLAVWYNELQQQHPTPHEALHFVNVLQNIHTALTADAAERLSATKRALHQAVTAIENWQVIATSIPFWQHSPTVNTNDRWAMYVGMEATTEVLAEQEAQLIRRRVEAHEHDDGLPFELAQKMLLARLRVLRACGEAILACWEWRPRCARAYLEGALAELIVWQELVQEAAQC